MHMYTCVGGHTGYCRSQCLSPLLCKSVIQLTIEALQCSSCKQGPTYYLLSPRPIYEKYGRRHAPRITGVRLCLQSSTVTHKLHQRMRDICQLRSSNIATQMQNAYFIRPLLEFLDQLNRPHILVSRAEKVIKPTQHQHARKNDDTPIHAFWCRIPGRRKADH